MVFADIRSTSICTYANGAFLLHTAIRHASPLVWDKRQGKVTINTLLIHIYVRDAVT